MSSTVCYTSESPSASLIMARIKAAGRKSDERATLNRKRMAYAEHVLSTLVAEGAVRIGVKVCGDEGKYRYVIDLDGDRDFILLSLASIYEQDAEVWGIPADDVLVTTGSVF